MLRKICVKVASVLIRAGVMNFDPSPKGDPIAPLMAKLREAERILFFMDATAEAHGVEVTSNPKYIALRATTEGLIQQLRIDIAQARARWKMLCAIDRVRRV